MILLEPSEEDKALTDEDKKISVPTLMVVTQRDTAILGEVQAAVTQASAGDNLQIERLPTSHWPMLEAREAVERLLEDFATKIRGA